MSIKQTLVDIEYKLEKLPKGTLTYKKINGKEQPYIQRTIGGKSVSTYVKKEDRETILIEFEERDKLNAEKQRLQAYLKELDSILKDNPRLSENVGVGYQLFDEFCYNHLFYVDKTYFINEWLNTSEKVTLITRPRRFGKTLLLSTVKEFFDTNSNCSFKDFEDLAVAKDLHTASLFRSRPVVFISFDGVQGSDYRALLQSIFHIIKECYRKHLYLLKSDNLSQNDKNFINLLFKSEYVHEFPASMILLQKLCQLIHAHFNIKPYLLFDGYDKPITESYYYGYIDEFIDYYRSFINLTFKTNEYFDRAIITGVNLIDKASLLDEFGHPTVYTTTRERYSKCFCLTAKEVKDLLRCQDIDNYDMVTTSYGGYSFGDNKANYNPGFINDYLTDKEFIPYVLTEEEGRNITNILQKSPINFKVDLEEILKHHSIHKKINELNNCQYLSSDTLSIYSYFLANGILTAENPIIGIDGYIDCDLKTPNQAILKMLVIQVKLMFSKSTYEFDDFIEHLLHLKLEYATKMLGEMLYHVISFFDVAGNPGSAPENFYHGLVLGLIASCQDRYIITSNRESGIGRYDVVMQPRNDSDPAFVMEFKVFDEKKEKTLEDTAKRALTQIEEKGYATDLITRGVKKEQIHKLAFALMGKEALITEG